MQLLYIPILNIFSFLFSDLLHHMIKCSNLHYICKHKLYLNQSISVQPRLNIKKTMMNRTIQPMQKLVCLCGNLLEYHAKKLVCLCGNLLQ